MRESKILLPSSTYHHLHHHLHHHLLLLPLRDDRLAKSKLQLN
jgi:hypothetical protein